MRPSLPAIALLPALLPALAAQNAAAQPAAATAAAAPTHRLEHVDGIPWRNLGPSNMGGRITDLEVVHGKPHHWYIAAAGGGIWKTTNAGTTWRPLFQNMPTASVGDVAVAPSDDQVVWVGTGEENARNSVQWGDGIYKSTDGGETFQHMGLTATFQIGHIAIHPRNPDVVYVAALGQLWGHNQERGVYRTRDGGATWQKVLYLDEKTGCIDVRIDPQRPSTVYAAMYERYRDRFDSNDPAVRFGEKSGLFRSDDGGDTWKELTRGLPTCKWGRSGLDIWQKNPNTLFAIIETERSGWATGESRTGRPARQASTTRARAYMGISSADGEGGAQLRVVTEGGPSAKAGLKEGDIVVQVGETKIADSDDLTEVIRESKGGDKTKVVVLRGGNRQTLDLTWGSRTARRGGTRGGRGGGFGGRLGGQRANVQDQQGEKGYETGGIFRSDDRGETWRRLNSLTERPFYYSNIEVDPQDDKHIYTTGVSFYASHDGGKRFNSANRGIHVDFHAIWVDPHNSKHILLACDGGLNESYDQARSWEVQNNFSIAQFYHCGVDNAVPYRVYGGLQDNGTWAGPSRSRFSQGATKADWVSIYSGDGFRAECDPTDPNLIYCTSQGGNIGCVNFGATSSHRISKVRGRYNWDTPYFLSPHNPKLLYYAGQHVGRTWNPHRSSGQRTEQLTERPIGLTDRGTATALHESPRQQGVLYAGTDDGALWRTKDDGYEWLEIHKNVKGLPQPLYCSSLRASRFADGRVYATFDGHRSNEFGTHVYVSEDYGDTWKSLIANLPDEPVHICIEDPRNEDTLFLGTEFSCYVSLDRGKSWNRLGDGLPTVAVRDLKIQDREADLIAGTHGRGLWVIDIEPIRQLHDTFNLRAAGEGRGRRVNVTAKPVHVFKPAAAVLWRTESRYLMGNKGWRAPNPPSGAVIYANFATEPEKRPTLTIHDVTGERVASVRGQQRVGIQRFVWSGRAGRSGAQPGSYSARLKVGDHTEVQMFELKADPRPAAAATSDSASRGN